MDIEKLKNIFKKQVPGFIDFNSSGPKFQNDEYGYKKALSNWFHALLDDWFNRGPDSLSVANFKSCIDQLLNKKIPGTNERQNLTGWRDNDILLIEVLNNTERSQEFMKLLYALLHEGKTGINVSGSLGSLLQWLNNNSCPPNLTKAFPSLFLFLWNPESHFFIKPQKLDQFLRYIEEKPLGTGKPLTTEEYARLLGIVNEIRTGLSDWHPRDMIDIQSFCWVVLSSLETGARKETDDGNSTKEIEQNDPETDLSTEGEKASLKPPSNLILRSARHRKDLHLAEKIAGGVYIQEKRRATLCFCHLSPILRIRGVC